MQSLCARAERLGVAENVRFLGFRSDLPALMRTADVVVLPSRWEGFGLVLLEAMDAARPIVATRVGPVPEVVVDGVTGVLVPPDDPASLAKAVVDLLRDPDRARLMGTAGRIRLTERFTERAMIQSTVALYNALLGDASLAASSHGGAARAATP
jgi:glycosyltransferase involved in cell wall biosynthesis